MIELIEATIRLITDKVTAVDTIFFHARAEGDDVGLFELVSRLYHDGFVRHSVLINGSKSGTLEPGGTVHSYPGVIAYRRRLEELNVHTVVASPAFNTLEENFSFLKAAKTRGWRSAIIIAQPHQLLRIFLGALKIMEKENYLMVLYAVCPSQVDWLKEVYGSQGQKFIPRYGHVTEEYKRIEKYQAKGDLATTDELLQYLNKTRVFLDMKEEK